jgi:phosphoribosylformylglycinamidine (FGAM) synthase-like enzyme
VLLHVDLSGGARRLGGSALAQAFAQVGDEAPDVAPRMLKAMWGAVQVRRRLAALGGCSSGLAEGPGSQASLVSVARTAPRLSARAPALV